MSNSISKAQSRHDNHSCFTFACLAILLLLSFFWVHGPNIVNIVRLWFLKPHSYAQGILIFLLAVYMIVTQRSDLKRLEVWPWIYCGTAMTAGACLLFLFGNLTDTTLVQQTSMILTLLGLILLTFGDHYFKALLIPVSYLVFLFPLFTSLLGSRILFLQNISATIASSILGLIGFTVFRQDHLIQLPHITLDVVEACSGLNHIISLVAIAIPLVFISRLSRVAKLAIILFAIGIGIFANGLRVALIGIWTYFNPQIDVHGPADFLLVSFVFLFGLFALVLVTSFLAKPWKNQIITFSRTQTNSAKKTPWRRVGMAIFSAITILILTKISSIYFETHPVSLPQQEVLFPRVVGDWEEEPPDLKIEKFKEINADVKIFKHYRHLDGRSEYVFIAYFTHQREDYELFSYPINILLKFAVLRRICLTEGDCHPMRYFKITTDRMKYDALAAYSIGTDFIADRPKAKIASLKNVICRRRSNGALVIFLAPQRQSVPQVAMHQRLAVDLLPVIGPGLSQQ